MKTVAKTYTKRSVKKIFKKPTMTKQNHKQECDINHIMKKYEKTGIITHFSGSQSYGDFSQANDYQTCLNTIMQAQDDFDALPSRIRKRFGNNPAQLIEFIDDAANYEEGVELGIFTKKQEVSKIETKTAKSAENTGEVKET